MGPYAQVGLAFGTSIGAWINLGLLFWFASRQNLIVLDPRLRQACVKLVIAAVVLAIALWLARWGVARAIPEGTALRDVIDARGGRGRRRHRLWRHGGRAVRPAIVGGVPAQGRGSNAAARDRIAVRAPAAPAAA